MSQTNLNAQTLKVCDPVTLFFIKGLNMDIKCVKHTFDWIMNGFTQISEQGVGISSPKFHLGEDNELEVNLVIHPQGIEGSEEDQASIFLQSSSMKISENCKYQAKATLSLMAANGTATSTHTIAIDEDFQIGIGWGIKNFFPVSYTAISGNGYWHNVDKCTSAVKIRCEIVLVTDNKNTETPSLKVTQRNLLENVSSLYTDKLLTDVTFVIGDEKLFAHKAILAARSEVFHAMFECDMTEAKTNTVKITDASVDAFKALLLFIYTGKVDCLHTLGEELLCMAEKYALTDLKDACERSLMKCLTMENALQVLVLADRFRAARLKDKAYQFYSEVIDKK